MTNTRLLLASLVLSIFPFTPRRTPNPPYRAPVNMRVAIERLQAEVGAANARIDHLQKLIDTAENKPYRDPKGLKRSHWQRLLGKWTRQLEATEIQLAWHTEQLQELQPAGDNTDDDKIETVVSQRR